MASNFGMESESMVDIEAAMEGLDENKPLGKKERLGVESAVYDRTLSVGMPSERLFGALPIARVVPQDIHSALDYLNGAAVASAFAASSTMACQIACGAFGASVIGVSLLTDYRLSLTKLIPIEAHELVDHLWGAALIAAPFVLGYWKKDRIASIIHIAVGASTILGSLFTDYRSVKRA